LPVIDNLERALAAGASRDSAQFHQGVEMTLKQLQQLLRQHGVESEEIVGKPFDPHRHEALSQGHDPPNPTTPSSKWFSVVTGKVRRLFARPK
jgi:molecular chaperone GrpE